MGEALVELAQQVPAPVYALSDNDLVSTVDRCFLARSELDAFLLTLVREFDARGLAGSQGATSTRAWLHDRQRISPSVAGQLVRLAAALDGSATGEALASGAVNVEQAQVIARALRDVPACHRAAGEAFLLEHAAAFGPRDLTRLGEHIFEVVAPEEADVRQEEQLRRAEERAYGDRAFHLTDVDAGRVRLSGLLDREGAAVVRAAIDPLCAPRTAGGTDLRSPAQRRADALTDICRLALASTELPDNGGDRPQVVVTMKLETLRNELGAGVLDDGFHVSAATARQMACDAAILPAVLGSAGQILDLGRERRLFTGPVRRAILLRDGGCAFPACDRPARWCQCHHIDFWANGGTTCLANGVAVCAHHHRLLHHSEWQVRINPADGLPEFLPPSYLDSERKPMRNKYHRRE